MKVNSSVSSNIQGTQTESLKKAEKSAKTERASQIEKLSKEQNASAPAAAEISSRGKEMAKASAIASATPDVREDRIAELKKRIAAGEYKVDTDAIADKMIGEHASM